MIDVRRPFAVALAGMLIGLLAAACSESDIILGERGDAAAGAGLDAAAGARLDAGSEGGAGSSGNDASAAVGGGSDGSAAGSSGGAVDAGTGSSTPRPSTGCGSEPVVPDDRIEVNGMNATYVLDLPVGYDKTRAYPVVMAFRRSDTTAEEFRASLGLSVAVAGDAIVVHPNPLGDASTWDVQRDLPLVDALLSKLAANYCVDQSRVFAVGLGQGALLANAHACVRSETWRGFAPLSAVLAPARGVCVGQAAVWLMQSGAEAATMTFGRENLDFWIDRNGCEASAPMAVTPSPCVAYAGCDAGFPVRFCEYDAELPSVAPAAIWDFFRGL